MNFPAKIIEENHKSKQNDKTQIKKSNSGITKNQNQSFFNMTKRPSTLFEAKRNEVQISELKGLIRNPNQFCWLFGVELKYHLPPKMYITWPYIIMILQGEKKLLKCHLIDLTTKIPKFDQLSIKRIWPRYKKK